MGVAKCVDNVVGVVRSVDKVASKPKRKQLSSRNRFRERNGCRGGVRSGNRRSRGKGVANRNGWLGFGGVSYNSLIDACIYILGVAADVGRPQFDKSL